MCQSTNFEMKNSKSKNFKREPKRVPVSSVEDTSSFGSGNKSSCIKRDYKEWIYT